QSISGELATATEANVKNVLIGAYQEAGKDESYGGQLQLMADLLGAGGRVNWTGTFIQPRQVFTKAMLSDNTFISLFWNNHYATINQANLVLDNLDKIESGDDERNRVEGEARFLRGLCYFDLVRHFGSGSTGVPLRTTGISDYAVDLSVGRASTNEVYELVISDLMTAVSLLPEENSFFADRYAAEGLLARVYLQRGNYAGARDAANNVITNSTHSLTPTFAGAFNNDADSSEDIFAWQVTSQDGQNDLINHYADEGNGGRGGDIVIADDYVALFEDDDVRGSFFYASGQGGARLTSKYTNQFGNIPFMRMAEMHLIRAEANLEEGTTTGATPLEDLNAIRARSGASALESADVNAVLQERVLELAFEGFFIHDITRTGRSVDGFAADANELVMPIPQSELDTNPLMNQNPGYN
ncbi:MAG: RagB/SusD family nutrient uptake outer membrane protein, partial [Bacteroidota bacterium]